MSSLSECLFISIFITHLRNLRNGCYANGPPGVFGIWGEWLFIFRDLGSTGNYFRGAGEQAHSFGDLGSPAIKQKNKIKEPPTRKTNSLSLIKKIKSREHSAMPTLPGTATAF